MDLKIHYTKLSWTLPACKVWKWVFLQFSMSQSQRFGPPIDSHSWIWMELWPKKRPKVKKGCQGTALKWRLMENSNCYEHANHMVLGIVCCLFCVFYIYKLSIHGGRRRWALCFPWFSLWACKLIYVGFCSSWCFVRIWLRLVLWITKGWRVAHIWRMAVLQWGGSFFGVWKWGRRS